MPDLPVLELIFQNVFGSPWEGEAMLRLAGNQYGPFAVCEGMTGRQRDDVRWYVEQYMDYPEGGHEKRARQIEQQLHEYGLALWDGLQQAPQLAQWLGAVQMAGGGRLELRANTPADEVAFRSPWELMRVGVSMVVVVRYAMVVSVSAAFQCYPQTGCFLHYNLQEPLYVSSRFVF